MSDATKGKSVENPLDDVGQMSNRIITRGSDKINIVVIAQQETSRDGEKGENQPILQSKKGEIKRETL